MNKSNFSIIDEYLSYVKLYENKYDKYLVLLAVGSFYEVYSILQDDPKLKEVCELLNLLMTRKNKSIQKVSKSNPHMAGIPCCSLQKYLDILIENNYTVIVYDQEDTDGKKKCRKLNKIYSIGTHINCEKEGKSENVILSIYRETIKENNICGISTINLATGYVNVLEIYNVNDITKLIEDLNKILIIHKPKEIIYSYNNNDTTIDYIYKLLCNNNSIYHHNKEINKEYTKISYQNNFLKNVYKNYNMGFLTPIEYLDMEKYKYSTISLIILLNFAYNYDNMIIEHINKPNIITDNNVLNLHNNALEQLNVVSLNNAPTTYKYNSLFDVVNKNSTKLGTRLLKKILSEPITDINELNTRYNLVEELIKKEKYKKYDNELKNIIDIEKYHKSLGIFKLNPYQYGRLNLSYISILNIINISKSEFKHYFDYNILNEYENYYNEYKKYFNIENLEVYSFNNKNSTILNIFNNGILQDVDDMIEKIQIEKNKLETLTNELSNLIQDSKFQIEIKCTDTSGYFLILTKTRATKLKKIIDSNNTHQDLIFENKIKASTYITSKSIKEISKNIIIYESKLYDIMKEMYYNITDLLYKKYYNVITYLNHFISYIDVFNSFAKVSFLNNYSKPIIAALSINSENSYMDIKNIRHPIIELLSTSTEYVTNNISINVDTSGILLYGVNASGKSSIMRALGLNLILAQIGCYTATTEFKYYPYNSIFTRLDKLDNLFKGYSSYEVEIMELKNILKYSDKHSLVLGDELLSSTESVSAISIISATINNFLNKNICFLFASHLFEIVEYIDQNVKNKLYIGHLKTEYDNKNKCFIYNRKLQNGMPNLNYGILVAQSIIDSKDIVASALSIQNKIINNNKSLLNTKKSTYNKDLYINECYLCKDLNILKKIENEVLETHHIIFQSEFKDNKCIIEEKKHIKKNKLSNLVTLCSHHHDLIHNDTIKINGWVQTTNGIKLDYIIN